MKRPRPTLNLSVLFSNPEEAPLFTSCSDLARAIFALPQETHSFRCAAITNLSSFLSQIERGERAAPPALATAIELALSARAKERSFPHIALAQTIFEMQRGTTASIETQTLLRPETLLERQTRAHDVLILNATPLELTETDKTSHVSAQLQQAVRDGVLQGRPVTYGIDTIETAHRLWRALLAREALVDPGHAEKRQRAFYDQQLIRIFLAPHWLLLTPTVALNRQRPDRYEAYIWEAPYNWDAILPLVPARRSIHLQSMQELLGTRSFIEPPKSL